MSVWCQQLPSAKPTQGRVSVTQNTTPADRLANGRNIVFAKNALPDRHPEPQRHQIHVRREPRVYLPRRDGAKAKAGCPVSKLMNAKITTDATLVG